MSLKQVAIDTLALLDAGRYTSPAGAHVDLADAQAAAVAGTRLYTPEQLTALLASPGTGTGSIAVEVTDETTQLAARRLSVDEGVDDLCLLNFASARNHGGGFINGAKAQEEDLCRCSGLYPALLEERVQAYYEVNRRQTSLLYTDHAIYSPRVPWFRTRGAGELLDAIFLASVITMPAPNAALLRKDKGAGPAIRATFARRWGQVLAIARDNGHRTVLLGAWGCGAFANDPQVAAETALPWLGDPRFTDATDRPIERVVFAIPRTGKRSLRNHDAFARVLSV